MRIVVGAIEMMEKKHWQSTCKKCGAVNKMATECQKATGPGYDKMLAQMGWQNGVCFDCRLEAGEFK